MNVEELIRKYLSSGKTRMMQIATSVNDQPWICTVYYAVDDDLNIYWLSKSDRRHSKEIMQNPKVSVTIVYDQQPPRSDHKAVQVEGSATLLEGAEAQKAADLYGEQLQSDQSWINNVKSGQDPHRVYKLTPHVFVLYDDVNFPNDSRQEWQIGVENE